MYVPESRAAVKRRLDPVGQVLVITALGTLSYGIIEGPDLGWGAAPIVACFAAAALATALLVGWSLRALEPLIDLRFFRSLAVLWRRAHRRDRQLRDGRVPLPHHAVPAGSPRVQRTDGGAVPRPDGSGHGGLRARVRPDDRPQRHQGAAAHRVRRHHRGRRAAHLPHRRVPCLVRAAVHRHLRRRHGLGQRAGHQQRRRRDAARPGRNRRGDRVDRPAGRLSPWASP